MVRHLHISKLEQIQASSDVWAGSLITRDAIFFNDICLRHHGELRAYKLRENHLPTYLEGGDYEVIEDGKCIDYLELAQANDKAWTIHELFPEHFWGLDFVEVPIAHDTWQPKIDELQAQIDDLDSTYATDAQVVASFAEQIAAAGDVFNLVDTKVGEEKTRAEAAELTLTQAVVTEKDRAEAAEAAIEAFFEGTDASALADRDQIKLDFASGDATNAAAVVTQKNRIDAILNLSDEDLNTFKEIEDAYKLADSSVETTVTNLVNARVTISTYNTEQAAQDVLISNNTGKVSYDASASALVASHTSSIASNASSVATKYATSDATTKHLAQDNSIAANASAVAAKYATADATAKHLIQDGLILSNTGKVSYDASASALVASHTSSIAANASAVAAKYASADALAKHALQDALISKVTSGTYVTSSGGAVTVGTNSVVIINHESGGANQLITLPTPVVVGKHVKVLFTKNNANYHWKFQAGGSDTISGAVIGVDSSATPDEVTHHASNGEGDNHITLKNTTRGGSWLEVVGTSTSNWAMNGVVIHAADAPGWG